MGRHNFPARWWDPSKGVRFLNSSGELWDCEQGKVVAEVGYRIELGEVD